MEVQQLVPTRDQTLHGEMLKQQNNERLRRAFAQKANVVGPWVEKHLDAVASVGAQGRESLEQQLAKLNQYEQNVQAYKPNMEDLEHLHQEVQEAMIFENRHTSYTMEVSRPTSSVVY